MVQTATTRRSRRISANSKVDGTSSKEKRAAAPVSDPNPERRCSEDSVDNKIKGMRVAEDEMSLTSEAETGSAAVSRNDEVAVRHWGAHAAQGRREYMEDVYSAIPELFTSLPDSAAITATKDHPVQFFAVFDGHGGSEASTFSSKHFPDEVKIDIEAGLCPAMALCNAAYATEVAFFRSMPGNAAGTTAACVLIETSTRRMWISNIGDSRVLLIRKRGRPKTLTTDHDAGNKTELRRIKAAGGIIDDGYVNASVQTSRSIGDRDAKFMYENDEDDEDGRNRSRLRHSAAVIPTPEITDYELSGKKGNNSSNEDLALIIACDGLFEAEGDEEYDPEWIAKIVRAGIRAGNECDDIAKQLVERAIDDGSSDNTTACVVLL